MGEQIRLPLRPKHCTVLGYRVKHHRQPLWAGLYLDLAEVREQASIMVSVMGSNAPPDRHLRVPWQHPEDRKLLGECTDDVFYRVRSRYRPGGRYAVKRRGKRTWRAVEDADFERRDGQWQIVLTLRSKAAPPLPVHGREG